MPINFNVSKLTKFGESLGASVRYWAESPDSGPEGWGARDRDVPVPNRRVKG